MTQVLTALPSSTIRLLGSSQVITSVFSVVKELVENALDAGATAVDVKLRDYGLGKIEVRDNGSGIPSTNVPYVARRYHTTKITSFSDLDTLTTYGFRGEALGSLSTVCSLSITTKTSSDDISLTYSFNNQGQITATKPSHLLQGTTITAVDLFKNLPVRRNYYNTNKRKKEELKTVEDLLLAYGVICPDLRLTLRHNKDIIWQKNPVGDLKDAVAILGRELLNNLEYREKYSEDPNINMKIFVPKQNVSEQIVTRSSNDRCFTFINKRPVTNKEIEKMVRQYHGCETGRWPCFVVAIDLPSSEVDVNVEPNKTQVFLQTKEIVYHSLRDVLEDLYGPLAERCLKEKSKEQSLPSSLPEMNGDCIHDRSNSRSSENCARDSSVKDIPHGCKITMVNHTDLDIPTIRLDNSNESAGSCKSDKIVTVRNLPDWDSESRIPFEHSICSSDKVSPTRDGGAIEINCSLSRESTKRLDDSVSSHFSIGNDAGRNHVSDSVCERITEEDPDEQPSQSVSACFDIASKELAEVINLSEGEDEPSSYKTETSHGSSQLQTLNSGNTAGSFPDRAVEDSEIADDTLADILKDWDESGLNNHSNTLLKDHGQAKLSKTKNSKQESVGNRVSESSSEQWSKGQGLKSSSGEMIQPASVLPAGKRHLSPTSESPCKKIRTLSTENNVQSQVQVKRNMTAFDIYSKTVTPKVIQEFPEKDIGRISQIIQERWISLPLGEKTQYELKAGASTCKMPKQRQTPVKSLNKLGQKVKQPASISIKEHLMKSVHKESSRITKDVEFCMHKLKKTFQGKVICSQDLRVPQRLQLIGPLKSCGVWTCCFGNQIKIIHPHRVQETVIFHSLMSNHVLPTQQLEKPIPVTKSRLGEDLWRSLENLAQKYRTDQAFSTIQDDRFINNGIKLQFYYDSDTGEFCCNLTGLSSMVPMYGVKDLAEILDLITNTGADTVSKSRPMKILHYLQGEAVRMARQLTRDQSKEEIQDIQDQMTSVLPKNCDTCFHGKPFFHTLYDMDDLPLTQSQS